MTSFWEILKASKGLSHEPFACLAAQSMAGGKVAELSGIPPLSFLSNGKPLVEYRIDGKTVQNGTPTPESPIEIKGVGDLVESGEHAGKYAIPISSANTTTPIYLGEVQTTRKIGKIDLGTLNWSITASGNFWASTAIRNIRTIGNTATGNAICDMFKEVSPNIVANESYSFSSCLNNVGRPFINGAGFEDLTVEEFKEAMSGVYMYYVLAEPETGIVTEPLMKIGNYADELHSTDADVTIPTVKGVNTLTVDTTVRPSNVSIKYKQK